MMPGKKLGWLALRGSWAAASLGDGRMVKIAHLAHEGQAIEQGIASSPVKQCAVKLGVK
jgi:hypothetical protein